MHSLGNIFLYNNKLQKRCFEKQKNEKTQNRKTVVVLNNLQLFENTIKKNCEILKKSGLEVEFISEYSDNKMSADYIISVGKANIDC